MDTLRSTWIAAALAIAAVLAPLDSQAQLSRTPDPVTVILDGAIARPAGAAVTVVGATLPFSAISRSTRQAWKSLVAGPARFTFRRPLGDFDRDL